ncbi:MAG: hypothetical protein ACO1OT_06780 [Heyndrickxia sp.]
MLGDTARELRNIRITHVILTIIILFKGGDRTVQVDHFNDSQQNYPQFSYSNMVDLGEGNFGVLSGYTGDDGNEMVKVYYYDKKNNKLIFKTEASLNELHQ